MDLSLQQFSEMQTFALVGLGLVVGAYGTMIGTGGGFLLVPALLLLAPDLLPAQATAISLAVVFFNAYAGTWTYARMGRIDYAAGSLFALAGIPGAILGTYLVAFIPREPFAIGFGILLLLLGIYLGLRPGHRLGPGGVLATPTMHQRPSVVGAIGSAYVGVFSSLLGIGGGILHVPFLVRTLRYPPHIATATSQFVLLFMALTGTVAHFISGELRAVLVPTAFIALGVMMGAPIGATLSGFIKGNLLVRLLALALCAVAGRLLWQFVGPWMQY